VGLEELGKLKNSITSSGIETAIFRLVAWCLNQPLYRVPLPFYVLLGTATTLYHYRYRVRTCGICGGQSCSGAGLLRVLQFPLSILIPPTAPHSLAIVFSKLPLNNIPKNHCRCYTQSLSKRGLEGQSSANSLASRIGNNYEQT
jgi:hypothetical protein